MKDQNGYRIEQFGAIREFDYEPSEYEDYAARWEMAHDFASAIFRYADVIRSSFPRGDQMKWTVGMKVTLRISPHRQDPLSEGAGRADDPHRLDGTEHPSSGEGNPGR